MATPDVDSIFAEVRRASQLYSTGQLEISKALALELEARMSTFEDSHEKAECYMYIAAILIDLGGDLNDEEMIRKAIQYLEAWITQYTSKSELAATYYNLANGYSNLWQLHMNDYLSNAIDADDHRLARHYYREAAGQLYYSDHISTLACEIWTNYGLSLYRVNRTVEAIDAYDSALHINPNFGMALGNKAIALAELAPVMSGYTHLFYLEAIRLLQKALEQPLIREARLGMADWLEMLNQLVAEHGEMKPEDVAGVQPTTDFHRFLCKFCAEHGLFLNPVTFLGDEGKTFYGDPLFISKMFARIDGIGKFDRYVTFLNEIKQDFVLARYFLAQSQYASTDIDVIDDGVKLYYPLDYSVNSTYVQLLKAANKQAIAVLDKISYFVYDYCKLKTPAADRVSFRQIWGGNNKIRTEFNDFASPYLFALFSLAHDVSKKGDFRDIFEYRDALTHRFLVLQDFQISNQQNPDIPRIDVDTFLKNTILALQIARAAMTYLVLFVEDQEEAENSNKTESPVRVTATPIEGPLRYRPH